MTKPMQEGLMFRGRPLIRQGNTLYYGSMKDRAITMLQELDSKNENGIAVVQK